MVKAQAARERIPSSSGLLLKMLVIVFLTEGAVMLLLPWLLGRADSAAAAIVDGVLLIVSSAPLLWFFVVRPLRRRALEEHQRATRLSEEVRALAIVSERQRLAREMHDSFAQTLGLLHLQLHQARERHAPVDPVVAADLGELITITEHAHDELRQSIFGLRMGRSPGIGWVPALREYVDGFETRMAITVRVESVGRIPERLPPSTEVQLARIVQESLANVAKHAQAKHARVLLEAEDGYLRVAIEDDGRGFQPEALDATARSRFGLQTMRERAESAGGKLDVDSAPGRGTRIVATLPCEV